jgi:site-specific recombinase XerC
MSKKKRTRRYQHGSLCESPDGKRWIVKFYYAPGKQTTKSLGPKSKISRRQAELMRDDLVRPLNQNPFRNLGEETFERYVEDVFFPMKLDTDWRQNTAKESMREIRKHLISELGDVRFEEITAALLRALLKKKAEQGLGKESVNHLRFFLTDICRSATAEGYLSNNVSEGLKAPSKVVKPTVPKTTVSLEQYAQVWSLLNERERLCFDLVMFAGMRESEAFALWCGNVATDGIYIERSFYKGLYEPPKTAKSDRHVGVPDEIMERLRSWISRLPSNRPDDCVFPSSKLAKPIWPESVLSKHVRPRLRPAGLAWVNFAVLRRSHSTLHKQRKSDLKVIADQQGHGMRTHLEEYVQSGLAERKAEASKLYADFLGVFSKRG